MSQTKEAPSVEKIWRECWCLLDNAGVRPKRLKVDLIPQHSNPDSFDLKIEVDGEGVRAHVTMNDLLMTFDAFSTRILTPALSLLRSVRMRKETARRRRRSSILSKLKGPLRIAA
jgi:hypothetical protein